MASVQAQLIVRPSITKGFRVSPAAVYGGLSALFATILGRHPRMNDGAVPSYEGHAWCDAVEGRLITDIAMHRRAGF